MSTTPKLLKIEIKQNLKLGTFRFPKKNFLTKIK